MKLEVNLPCRVEVVDYHEFPFLQDQLKQIIPGIKVFEVGCTGKYQGIAYIGRKNDLKVKSLIKEIKEEQKIVEDEYYCKQAMRSVLIPVL